MFSKLISSNASKKFACAAAVVMMSSSGVAFYSSQQQEHNSLSHKQESLRVTAVPQVHASSSANVISSSIFSSVISFSLLQRVLMRSSTTSALLLAHCDSAEQDKTTTNDDESPDFVDIKDEREVLPLYVEDLIDTPEAEAEWDAQKEKCSFCRHFMLSPCRQEFKKWAKCVDLAKEKDIDFVQACQHYTRALMSCTESNSEYFAATRPDEGDDEQSSSESAQQEGKQNNEGESNSDQTVDQSKGEIAAQDESSVQSQ